MNDQRELTHQLRLPLLLPEVDGTKDRCIARLTESLLRNHGVSRAHVDESGSEAMLCMHYDPNLIPLQRLESIARSAGAGITKRFRHESLRLLGMGCTDCAASIEHVLGRMEGIEHVSVNYAAERMRLEYDTSRISHDKIVDRIRNMGYDVSQRTRRTWLGEHWELALSLASGLFLIVGFFGGLLHLLPRTPQLALYILAYLAGGFNATRHGMSAAAHLKFDIDFLMVVAAVGAAAIGQWAEGALLLFLFSLGHALEHSALGTARRAIDELGDLVPREALVRRNGREIHLSTDGLLRGDIVIVRPGERIPIDGRILSGDSAVDESAVTGESVPREKSMGMTVYAGTINGDGALTVEVTKLARETMISRIIAMVEDAQTQKAPTERVVERFERVFVPIVLVGVAGIIVLPSLTGLMPFREALLRAMTVLVATSPCALAIATPAAILSGIARAARGGVLIKGGLYLETLGRIKAAAFDKTGTITAGKPVVEAVLTVDGESEEQVLAIAAAAEGRSKHPLAAAVVAAAARRGIEVPAVDEGRSIGGKGLEAHLRGKSVSVGNAAFLDEGGITIPEKLAAAAAHLQQEGKTVTFVAEEGALLGALAFNDLPRSGAADALDSLRRLGVRHLTMLTGDNERVAQAIGRRVGIDDVRAGLLPDEKVAAVETIVREHGLTAMIGDGVNDAPALAHASVGVAMGAHGSDVAIETADVALMSDDLSKLPFALGLSRRARRIVLQNLVVAVGVIAVLLVSAVSGFVGIGGAIVVHEGSTLLVVANALRLLGFRSEAPTARSA